MAVKNGASLAAKNGTSLGWVTEVFRDTPGGGLRAASMSFDHSGARPPPECRLGGRQKQTYQVAWASRPCFDGRDARATRWLR